MPMLLLQNFLRLGAVSTNNKKLQLRVLRFSLLSFHISLLIESHYHLFRSVCCFTSSRATSKNIYVGHDDAHFAIIVNWYDLAVLVLCAYPIFSPSFSCRPPFVLCYAFWFLSLRIQTHRDNNKKLLNINRFHSQGFGVVASSTLVLYCLSVWCDVTCAIVSAEELSHNMSELSTTRAGGVGQGFCVMLCMKIHFLVAGVTGGAS